MLDPRRGRPDVAEALTLIAGTTPMERHGGRAGRPISVITHRVKIHRRSFSGAGPYLAFRRSLGAECYSTAGRCRRAP